MSLGLSLLLGAPHPLLSETDRLAWQVSRVRQLPVRWRVDRAMISKTQFRHYLDQETADPKIKEEIAIANLSLQRLGVLGKGVDLERASKDSLTDMIGGFYEPGQRKLFIADWAQRDTQRPVLVHELVHALQDQHFQIARLLKEHDADKALAQRALVEGDANLFMTDWIVRPKGVRIEKLPQLTNDIMYSVSPAAFGMGVVAYDTSRFLRRHAMFPYEEGMRFAHAFYRTGGWGRISRLFRDPPVSTEQILHPDKYPREKPKPVPALGELAGFTKLDAGSFGEFSLRTLLEEAFGPRQAMAMAAGWGGDRLTVLRQGPGDVALVYQSVWDTEKDAKEFEKGLDEWMARQAKVARPNGGHFYSDIKADLWIAGREGSYVWAVLGVHTELAPDLVQAVKPPEKEAG